MDRTRTGTNGSAGKASFASLSGMKDSKTSVVLGGKDSGNQAEAGTTYVPSRLKTMVESVAVPWVAAGPSRPRPALPIARHRANAIATARRRSRPGGPSGPPSRSMIRPASAAFRGRRPDGTSDRLEEELPIAALVHLIRPEQAHHDQGDVHELGGTKPRPRKDPKCDREEHDGNAQPYVGEIVGPYYRSTCRIFTNRAPHRRTRPRRERRTPPPKVKPARVRATHELAPSSSFGSENQPSRPRLA